MRSPMSCFGGSESVLGRTPQSGTTTQERHVLVCGPCRLWAMTQAHSLGTCTECPAAQAWSHEPDSLRLCVSAQPLRVCLLPIRSPLCSGPTLLGKQSFITWSKLLEERVGLGLQKEPPEHLPGQPAPGQPRVVWCAWTAGVHLQAPACGPGVTAWQAQTLLQTLPQSRWGRESWTCFLGPVQPFSEWPLDGAVVPPGEGAGAAGGPGRCRWSLRAPGGCAWLCWRQGAPAASPGSTKPPPGAQRLPTHTRYGSHLERWDSSPCPCPGCAEAPGR